MNQVEFNAGWRLLLYQPWAYRYKSVNEFGELSSESKGQSEFYFESLKGASGDEWIRICKEHAKGKEWPSIDTLKRSLSSVKTYASRALDPDGGPLLDHEEFGSDLFDAIRLQSAQIQEEKNALLYAKTGFNKLANWSKENAEKLRGELAAIFQRDTLTPDDLRRVLAIGSEPTR